MISAFEPETLLFAFFPPLFDYGQATFSRQCFPGGKPTIIFTGLLIAKAGVCKEKWKEQHKCKLIKKRERERENTAK